MAAVTALPDAPGIDPATAEILDAALEILATLGIRKTTIEDIARQAGVDRVTVYRRLGTKNDVVGAVLAREAQRVFERVAASADKAANVEERVALVFAGLVRDLRGHALFNKILIMEPDTTVAKVTTGAADLLRLAVHFAVANLFPDVEPNDPKDLTARVEIVARLIHSLFLTPDAVVALRTRAQLLAFARVYVVPIITGGTHPRRARP
jgi:AcrR family transcriptional regulator